MRPPVRLATEGLGTLRDRKAGASPRGRGSKLQFGSRSGGQWAQNRTPPQHPIQSSLSAELEGQEGRRSLPRQERTGGAGGFGSS